MKHSYAVTVEKTSDQDAAPKPPITFSVDSHDDFHDILDKIATKDFLGAEEREAFVVGLKLFAGVLLRHRADPPFADLAPHFGAFMKALKA